MEILIVDRVEGGCAVCERDDLSTVDISLDKLPDGTKSGSVISVDGEGNYSLEPDIEQARRKKILALQEDIFS